MAFSSKRRPQVLRNVTFEISGVNYTGLHATLSQSRGVNCTGASMNISPILVGTLFPGLCKFGWPHIPDMRQEFSIGDLITVDLWRDSDRQYVPLKIHSIERYREDGCHVNALGLVVRVTTNSIVHIRSNALSRDITVDIDKLYVPDNCRVVFGTVVTFEALSNIDLLGICSRDDFSCNEALVYPPTVKEVGFACYRDAQGRLFVSESDNTIRVDFSGDTVLPRHVLRADSLPVLDGVLVGNTTPMHALLGEYVCCSVCPQQPVTGTWTFEVVSMDSAKGQFRIPDTENAPSSKLDGIGECSRAANRSLCMSQCNKYYNVEIEERLKQAFPFVVEHVLPRNFQRIIEKYPDFVEKLAKAIGLYSV